MKKLINLIKKDSKYIRYIELKKVINKNTIILNKIEELKKINKELTYLENLNLVNKSKLVRKKYIKIKDELFNDNTVKEFIELHIYFTILIKEIKDTIELDINEALNAR